MGFKIERNLDEEFFKDISERVRQNNGYCPCKIERSAETKCICREFLEQKSDGYCHCKRYRKIVDFGA